MVSWAWWDDMKDALSLIQSNPVIRHLIVPLSVDFRRHL